MERPNFPQALTAPTLSSAMPTPMQAAEARTSAQLRTQLTLTSGLSASGVRLGLALFFQKGGEGGVVSLTAIDSHDDGVVGRASNRVADGWGREGHADEGGCNEGDVELHFDEMAK